MKDYVSSMGISHETNVAEVCVGESQNVAQDVPCGHKGHRMYITPNELRTYDGATFLADKNPLVKTTLEIVGNPNLRPEKSSLYRYCNDVKPNSYSELMGLQVHDQVESLSQYADFRPWCNARPLARRRAGTFGPKHITYVEHNIQRLRNLLISIRELSYCPRIGNNAISGYLLKTDYAQRLVITEGHHRAAVIIALNYLGEFDMSTVEVVLGRERSWKFPGVVFEEKNVDSWPGVQSRFVNETVALEIFWNVFCGKTSLG